MNRRTAIKMGIAAAGVAAAGVGGYHLWPLSRSRDSQAVDVLARRFVDSLSTGQRAETCVEYNHPLRQYHNRGVPGGGRAVFSGFSRSQRQTLTDLMYAGLSEDGRTRIPEEFFTRWTGVNAMNVLVCGDPSSPPYQLILTGPHLNLRLGGSSREGAAFGGPQVYGDQRGNGIAGLPENRFRHQFLLGRQIFESLDPGRRKLALVAEAPVQTQIELQGDSGKFPGIPVSELTPESRALTLDLVDRILAPYPPGDVAFARQCLEANGGVDSLWLSYYQHGEDGDIFEAQVFRLEGPAAVMYYRGFPHLHAFINIAMDANAPLSSGELLGTNPEWLDAAGVKALFETAMRRQTSSDLAYYDVGSVAGRLRSGPIRSGDIYSLESWQEATATAEIRGHRLGTALIDDLKQRKIDPNPAQLYTITTSEFAARELQAKLGRLESVRRGPMLRDLVVADLRSHGLPSARA